MSWTEINGSVPAENQITEVAAGSKTICLARKDGLLYAFAQKCPHASGYFVNGIIDKLGNVVCPLHRYRFSLKNGRNTSGEGYFLKTWPVEERENGVFVDLPKDGIFSWLT